MMMQEILNDENHRSLNYTKIDRCQDNISIDNDESYRQIFCLNGYFNSDQEIKIPINLINRFHLILFLFLFLTSQSNALPASSSYIQQPSPSYPIAMVQLTDRSGYPSQPFNVYRRFSNPVNQIPSYSNGAGVQVYNQQSSDIAQNQQLRRERQRRAMIDKMITIFDEDGNGQLAKDELYSMALRSNMFPKFHQFLKQTSA